MTVPPKPPAESPLDDLIDEHRRIVGRFRSAAAFIIGSGFAFAALIDLGAVWIHGFGSPDHYLFDMNLGLQPSEGLATAGVLLGVAITINIALAAQDEPVAPRQKIRVAFWQQQMILIMMLSGIFTVTTTALTWTSNPQPRNWGDPLIALLLAATAVGVAAAQPSARPLEALVLDEKMLKDRLTKLDEAQQRSVASGAWRDGRFPDVILAMFAVGGSAGLITRFVGLALFAAAGTPVALANVSFLAGMAAVIATSALFGASSYWTGLAVRLRPRRWPAVLLPAVLVAAFAVIAVLTPGPYGLRVAYFTYILLATALPVALCVLEGRRPGLRVMRPVRSASTRAIMRNREEIESELADVRQRQQRQRQERAQPAR